MNPLDPSNDNPKSKVSNELTVQQAGERTIFHVTKHPIALIGPYSMSGVVTIIVAILTYYLSHNSVTNGNASLSAAVAGFIFVIAAVIAALFSYFVTKVHMANSWTLTTDSLTQVLQSNLFDRESSQLSLHNLEDISSEQNGFFPHLFNYGLIKVETAGEKSKFVFNFCPNPNFYARQILAARENFLLGHRDAIAESLTGSKYNTLNYDKNGQSSPGSSTQTMPAKPKFLDPNDVAPPEPIQSQQNQN